MNQQINFSYGPLSGFSIYVSRYYSWKTRQILNNEVILRRRMAETEWVRASGHWPRPKIFTLWLDFRFPHRQTSSCESRPVHLQLHHSERRSPTGLCPESPALLSLHTWLRVLSQLHFYCQICRDRILGWGRETYIMVLGQLSLSEREQN